MPTLEVADLIIDYSDNGSGPPVVLVHSSVSGNRQWKRLILELEPEYRVLALNLYGYGDTTPWRVDGTQTIHDQAQLVLHLLRDIDEPVRLAGHSFGGTVALKAAAMLGTRASHLFLFEPNPFYLLAQNGRSEAFAEAAVLRDFIKEHGRKAQWTAVAERFVDYWLGDGIWAGMLKERQAAYEQLLLANFFEWDCMESDLTPIETFARLPAKAMLAYAPGTRRPIREIAELFEQKCPAWRFATVEDGGHMAPMTRSDLVNPLIADFFKSTQ